MMPAIRLLVLLMAALPALAIQVAPLEPQIAPMYTDDWPGDAETNGESTLVAWTAAFSPYRETHGIAVRLLDSDHGRLTVGIASGYDPHVATNGSEYMVAYSIAASRFWTEPYPNVGVTIVNAHGTRGATRILNVSRSGTAGGIAWNGSQWIVSYTNGSEARAAIIERDLSVKFVDLGSGTAGRVEMIDGSAWIVREAGGATGELIEVASDGSVGRRHSVPGSRIEVVPTASGAILFTQTEDGVQVARFDPVTGAAASRLVAGATTLLDAESWDGGAAVLMTPVNGSFAIASAVDAEGNAVESGVVVPEPPAADPYLRLGRSRYGVVLLYARSPANRLDLYSWTLTSLTPIDPERGFLLSVEDIAEQTNGALAAAHDHVVAIWSQTVAPDGTAAVFSRKFDTFGQPLSPAVQLPMSLAGVPAMVFDGEKFLIGWQAAGRMHLATLSSDGTMLGTPFIVGPGSSPVLARSGTSVFLAWTGADQQVWGTPLHEEGSPVVPSGFPILSTFNGPQSAPRIAAHPRGFHLLWSDQTGVLSVIVSPSGTPLSSTELAPEPADGLALASSTNSALAAWLGARKATLYAFGADRPFELFDPFWGDNWIPLAISVVRPDVYLCVIARDGLVWTAEITMSGAFITNITPLRPLARTSRNLVSVVRTAHRTLILYEVERELHLGADVPSKRRAAGPR